MHIFYQVIFEVVSLLYNPYGPTRFEKKLKPYETCVSEVHLIYFPTKLCDFVTILPDFPPFFISVYLSLNCSKRQNKLK